MARRAAPDAAHSLPVRPPKVRVFFALWPDADVAARLDALGAEAHADCGGRRTRRDTLHLTLAFIGDIDAVRVPALIGAADTVAVEPLTLCLDRVGSWRHNRIAWAGTQSVPAALTTLANGLIDALRAAGFQLERRNFAPHVTLLRRIHDAFPERDVAPVDWRVERFVLVESQRLPQGAQYRILAQWPAGGSAGCPVRTEQ